MPALQFISDMIKSSNEDRPALDFNLRGLKYVISEYTTKELDRSNDRKVELEKYPEIISFLKSIAKNKL